MLVIVVPLLIVVLAVVSALGWLIRRLIKRGENIRYCKNCGKEIEENAMFCQECGTAVEKESESVDLIKNRGNQEVQNQRMQATQGIANVPIAGYNPKWDYTPIGMWGYFGYQILFMIPLLGLIFLIVFAFGATRNINLRNYARSFFCIYIILVVVGLIAYLLVLSL